MTEHQSNFIWYELLTSDPDAAGQFYGDVIGWNRADSGQPGVDYRFFSTGEQVLAGFMKLPDEAATGGARPGWLGYLDVPDTDATVAAIQAAGGQAHMPAMDLPGVGRMAMVADPQGVSFYVMKPEGAGESRSFGQGPGHCNWNELATGDPDAAVDFYTRHFGWRKGDAMPMGELGEYRFVHRGEPMIGGVMRVMPGGPPPAWTFYFGVPDIDEGHARVKAGGGTVHNGPMEIPGGEYALVASDPQGAIFGLVGPRKQETGQ